MAHVYVNRNENTFIDTKSYHCRNVVVTQPGKNVWEFEHPWSHKLFSCCDDAKQCKYQ
jgi:hypothetical protein